MSSDRKGKQIGKKNNKPIKKVIVSESESESESASESDSGFEIVSVPSKKEFQKLKEENNLLRKENIKLKSKLRKLEGRVSTPTPTPTSTPTPVYSPPSSNLERIIQLQEQVKIKSEPETMNKVSKKVSYAPTTQVLNMQKPCNFSDSCKNDMCTYWHPNGMDRHGLNKPIKKCLSGDDCYTPNCKFNHPSGMDRSGLNKKLTKKKICRNGDACDNPECTFFHAHGDKRVGLNTK
jgi:hypothetical protein